MWSRSVDQQSQTVAGGSRVLPLSAGESERDGTPS